MLFMPGPGYLNLDVTLQVEEALAHGARLATVGGARVAPVCCPPRTGADSLRLSEPSWLTWMETPTQLHPFPYSGSLCRHALPYVVHPWAAKATCLLQCIYPPQINKQTRKELHHSWFIGGIKSKRLSLSWRRLPVRAAGMPQEALEKERGHEHSWCVPGLSHHLKPLVSCRAKQGQ